MLETLLLKITPLYFLIAIGFIAGKTLEISKKSIADIVIYIISPIVFFGYVAQIELSTSRLFLPALTFLMPLMVSLIWLSLGKLIFNDNRRNLAAYTSACGNTGYFGVPVYISLFGSESLGLYTLAIIGYMFFECGPGYFLLAKGKHSFRESCSKVLKLPALYAASAGIAFNLMGFKLPEPAIDLVTQFKGAYVVLGMMLIGYALSSLESFKLDLKFISFSYLGKFLAMPLLGLIIIQLLISIAGVRDTSIFQVLTVFSCVPLAANLTAYAAQLDYYPEKVASAVLISTGISLIHLPIVLPYLLSLF